MAESFEKKQRFEELMLHGTLRVTIFEISGLASDGILHNIVRDVEQTLGKSSKLYVTVDINEATLGQTSLIEYNANAQWKEQLILNCAHFTSNIVFTLIECEAIKNTFQGNAFLPITNIIHGEEVDTRLDILDTNGKIMKKDFRIHVKVKFMDVNFDQNWNSGICTPDFPGVPNTFFTQKNQCKVTLYQDAHTDENFVPKIVLTGGKFYEPRHCWEDIFHAISNAKKLIYIAGWSIYTRITLIRSGKNSSDAFNLSSDKLGDLLIKKANEGVKVLMLVWKDKSATSLAYIGRDGLMQTHCKETQKYFDNTGVHCVLCPRDPDNETMLKEFCFSHHQKVVVVDSELPGGSSDKRRIVSFVGGLDLCDGRYDTQSHSLFRTLSNVHQADFYQKNFDNASINKGGPREPWHDVHCRLEGPVAWDVLYNFEQRWRKQGIINEDLLVDVKDKKTFISCSEDTIPDYDQDTWKVQLFRSIDSRATCGFPDSLEKAKLAGLQSGRDGFIDRSIQDAYIHAIRRAKRFIYIENQYFIGSSFDWKEKTVPIYGDIEAYNLIPKELSLKIISKIEKGERFTVYVVIPMWPEGIPDSEQVQDILRLQIKTMQMMYTDIVKALRAQKSLANPEDYLSFFCLGNREVKMPGEYEPSEKPKPNTDYFRAQAARRFMIYVHSKMMIVDDEYIIIGSANINERSMNGARDTEIAMGAYQPYHICRGKDLARGEIHGFRMSLWHEHIGHQLNNLFLEPESLECVREVNNIARSNLVLYSSETLQKHDLPGHLLKYPIEVDKDGNIVELHGWTCFPDTYASVLNTSNIPNTPVLPPIIFSMKTNNVKLESHVPAMAIKDDDTGDS